MLILQLLALKTILPHALADDFNKFHERRADEFYNSCTMLFDMIKTYKDYLGPNYCEKISRTYGVCARNITVLFSYSEPLIYEDENGDLQGVLKGYKYLNYCYIYTNIIKQFIHLHDSYLLIK